LIYRIVANITGRTGGGVGGKYLLLLIHLLIKQFQIN